MASPASPNSSQPEPNSPSAQPNSSPALTQQPPPGERIEGSAQTVIMLAIGIAAGAASFTHVHDVAAAHGQPGWLAWTDAIVLELTSIAAGLDLRRRKRAKQSVRFPAIVLTVAVILSLSAQVVHAEPSVIGWIAAGVPALGFLAMVKMTLGRADPDQALSVPGTDIAVPAHLGHAQRCSPAVPGEAASERDSPRIAREEMDVSVLLPAAIEAAQTLNSQGISISRTTLARQLRADGHQLSTAAATLLIRLLRDSPPNAPAGMPGDSPGTDLAPDEQKNPLPVSEHA